MTNNIDRAAQVILQSAACTATEVSQTLAAEGLLMPDLPEPQLVPTGREDRVYLSWRGDPVDVEQGARITELFAPGESFPILGLDADEARCLGLRLLSAYAYAERNQE